MAATQSSLGDATQWRDRLDEVTWTNRISPSDACRFLQALAEGRLPQQAAAEAGSRVTPHRMRMLARRNPPLLGLLREAVELGAEARRDFVDETVEGWVLEGNAPDVAPSIVRAWMNRWQPAYADRQQVAVTGAGGGPLQVDGGRVVSLRQVIELAAHLGVDFGQPDAGDPGAAVPAAAGVRASGHLPAGEPAAGAVPADRL